MRLDNSHGESIQSVDNILTVMQRVNESKVNEKGRLYYVIDSRSGMPDALRLPMNHAIKDFAQGMLPVMLQMYKLNQ